MRSCRVVIILLLGMWQVSSCQGDEAVSTVKFITHHGLRVERMPEWYLIHKVKQSSWKIHYGFSDNNRCHSSGIDDNAGFEQELRASIIEAVKLWLQPLRDNHDGIVNTFELQLKDTMAVKERSLREMGAEQKVVIEADDPAHFRITFNCVPSEAKEVYPRSFVLLGKVPQVFMFHYRAPAGGKDQRDAFPDDKMSSEHMFMMTTLLHELGHIFGLKDVYIEPSKGRQSLRTGINYSTGGSDKTVGKQPNSIMGVASIIGLREKKFVITTDDEEAIKWLYLQAHEGVALNACPTDYEMEKDTDGCVPRFPLIFAVREGDKKLAKQLLAAGSIDIDSCDRYGNTALSYAQQGKHGHGQAVAKLLLDAGADPTTTCSPTAQLAAVQTATEEADTYTDKTASAADHKDKFRCSTLTHHDVSGNKLLLLLLMLPALLAFPLHQV